jgi:hypothetical protein
MSATDGQGLTDDEPTRNEASADLHDDPEIVYPKRKKRLVLIVLMLMIGATSLLLGFVLLHNNGGQTMAVVKPGADPERKPEPESPAEPKPSPQSVALFRNLAYRLSFPYYWQERTVDTAWGLEPQLQGNPEPTAALLFLPYSHYNLYNEVLCSESIAYNDLVTRSDQAL